MEGQGESSMVRIFHHIVACEAFYVHNNIVIYLERRKTVPEELLHPAYMYPSCNQISYSTDLCYITRRHKKFSLTSLLRIYHLSHVIADFGLCHITLDLNYIYSTALKLDSPCPPGGVLSFFVDT